MKQYFIFFILIIFFVACSSHSVPGNVIQPETMKKILWEMTVADEIKQMDTLKNTRLHLKDSITLRYNKILLSYHLTEDEYKNSLKFYEANPKQMQELLDSTASYGNKIKIAFQKKYKSRPTLVDSTKKKLPLQKRKDSLLHINNPALQNKFRLQLNHPFIEKQNLKKTFVVPKAAE